jgi:TolB-like protein
MFLLFLLTGCQRKSLNYASTFPNSIEVVAKELTRGMTKYKNNKIVFTSLVDLNNFEESSNFGRLFSESLMTQMSSKGYSVIEYRGDDIVSKSQKGEFRLNRARLQTLKDKDIFILVGTYSKMDDNVIVNVRIIDKETNTLVAATSVYIPLKDTQETKILKKNEVYRVQLIPARCSEADYCWRDLNE